MPFASADVATVQFGEFFLHGVAIVPTVTSLKTHVLAGLLALQADEDSCAASVYNAGLAFPWRSPALWSTRAMMPAKV
jgi:hypothetical protein